MLLCLEMILDRIQLKMGRIFNSEDFIILCQVNKALPRVEQELEDLIADWERLHQVANSQHQNF